MIMPTITSRSRERARFADDGALAIERDFRLIFVKAGRMPPRLGGQTDAIAARRPRRPKEPRCEQRAKPVTRFNAMTLTGALALGLMTTVAQAVPLTNSAAGLRAAEDDTGLIENVDACNRVFVSGDLPGLASRSTDALNRDGP
jgi:hypothetical protein